MSGLPGWSMIKIFNKKLQAILSNHGLGLIQTSMPNHLRTMVFIWTAGILVGSYFTTMPLAPRKRPYYGAGDYKPPGEVRICDQYNDNNGNCRFGKICHYSHICRACRAPYPENRCKKGQPQSSGTQRM